MEGDWDISPCPWRLKGSRVHLSVSGDWRVTGTFISVRWRLEGDWDSSLCQWVLDGGWDLYLPVETGG